ncbi:gag protein [Lentinula edodes]|uniref:Gag protein n=1 Tax=Lentinula edodes TaxID=5353 RepID=A0A1Q3ERU0_LENED|nr:gag protein [Lentinula edodes]
MSDPAQPAQPAPTPPTANDLMAQLIKQVANLATARSSMNKPKIFKGKDSAEVRRFMAQFQNWASEQPDLTKESGKAFESVDLDIPEQRISSLTPPK